MRVKKRRSVKKASKISNANTIKCACSLCDKNCDEPYLGELLIESNFSIHENCLFFSPVLHQELDPSVKRKGYILGFRISDIEKEIKRIGRLKCFICKKRKAGIGCCNESCKRSYHLVCGLQSNAMGIFTDSFKFYCNEHAIRQDLRKQIESCGNIVPECAACLDSMATTEDDVISAVTDNEWALFMRNVASRNVIHAGCCTRAWLHRVCMSKHCLASGLHHVKCPNCGNKSVYIDTALKYGIWIPDRDAAWEMEPGAFQEMYENVVPPDDDTDLPISSDESSEGNPALPVALDGDTDTPVPLESTDAFPVFTLAINDENKHPISAGSPSRSFPVEKIQSDIRKFFVPSAFSQTITSCPSLQKSEGSSISSKKRSLTSNSISSSVPIKRKRRLKKASKPLNTVPLVNRFCSICSRSLVCFSVINNNDNARSILSPKANTKVDHDCCCY